MDPRDEHLNLQNPDVDDIEDTLSLCDLPMYADCEDFSTELDHQSSSSSSISDEDSQYFEFFSEEWNIIPNKTDTNIIFCGKLIPYKQPLSDFNHKSKINQPSNRGLLQWNSKSVSTKSNNSPTRKVSMPVKTRWYMYMFGLVRYPMNNVEIRDIRRRQSRKIIKSGSSGSEKSGGRSSGKGIWRIIRALGCNGQNRASAAMKAALGVAPQLAGE